MATTQAERIKLYEAYVKAHPEDTKAASELKKLKASLTKTTTPTTAVATTPTTSLVATRGVTPTTTKAGTPVSSGTWIMNPMSRSDFYTSPEAEAQAAIDALDLGTSGMGNMFTEIPPKSQWPEGYYPAEYIDNTLGFMGYYWSAIPPQEEMSETERRYITIAEREAALAEQKAQRDYEQQLWERQQYATAQPMSEYQQWQTQYSEEQAARDRELEQQRLDWEKKQTLATMATQPRSWLEYSQLGGTTAQIQPWMLPLMPQQYSQLQAGGAIPGYSPTATSLGGMPQLVTPSRQYQARMGPTAQEQYLGYQQAQSGILPEEQQWRLWSQTAAPGGQYSGLSYRR